MSRDLTMSMVVDRHDVRRGVTLRPRVPVAWIPDERVRACFGCSVAFSFMRRKHHCRLCGRVFCDACTSYRERLPSWYNDSGSNRLNTANRMCASCARESKMGLEVEWMVVALSVMPLTFPELFKLRLLDRNWNHAVNTMLSLYRGLQYMLPGKRYSRIESNFLSAHYAEFGHHIPWQVHAFCSAAERDELSKFCGHMDMHHHLNCRWLLCSRVCSPRLSIDNILRLGTTPCVESPYIVRAIVDTWRSIHPDVHCKMMFWWVYLALKNPMLFRIGLIPMCSTSIQLTYALWFECQLQKESSRLSDISGVQDLFLSRVSVRFRNELGVSRRFVKLLTSIVSKNGKRLHNKMMGEFLLRYPRIRLPWNPSVIIVNMQSTKRFRSSSSPLCITCTTTKGRSLKVLIKQEDVRTDRLAMVISSWISCVTKQYIRTYAVFPCSLSMGCLEMIDFACTLYDVRQSSSLLNYIMSRNPGETVQQIRANIVRSCAGACLLAFTVGLGDRHLENILVAYDGSLAHVDFGYVLGEDPKMMATPMRITEDMIDAMGGRSSSTFMSFVKQTQSGYETMRQYPTLWYHLLAAESYIHRNPNRSLKHVREHILNRFVPGEWNEEASLHIQTVVQRAAIPSYFQQAADMLHLASNQMTHFFHTEL